MRDSHESDIFQTPDVLVIGAGPAGLTAARQLLKSGLNPLVVEKDNLVGGISRTVTYKGYLFDIGGHRFFTKIRAVEDIWNDILNEEFLLRRRQSRIYYAGKFFHYPLKPFNALAGLGILDSFQVAVSYLRAHFFPVKNEQTFEHWITNRFGSRLYEIFFKSYTEKVWGMPCSQISADWAAQRIRGLSLKTVLFNALLGSRTNSKQDVIKTLVDTFHYPARGPGMMWSKVCKELSDRGHEPLLECNVTRLHWESDHITTVEVQRGCLTRFISADQIISSMPVQELVRKLEPEPPSEVMEAADALKYRDFITVAIIIDEADVFPDNWIYIHEQSVRVGRIQNFKNWSPHMVPDAKKTCLGLEYFCFEGDGLWNMPDDELKELAKQELGRLRLVDYSKIEDGTVIRMPKAYPVYDSGYEQALEVIRCFLAGLKNLQLVGRNGMHKYNNQDHSMLTAMLAVENILGASHDLWSVNTEQDYHEELSHSESRQRTDYSELASTQPRVPETVTVSAMADEMLTRTFARLDKAALAFSIGSVCAGILLIVTFWSMAISEPAVGARLQLLDQYFLGYAPSLSGALLGSVHAFAWGFGFGWLVAYLRNLMTGLYIALVIHRIEAFRLKYVLDYI